VLSFDLILICTNTEICFIFCRSRPYSPLSPSSDPGSPDAVIGKSCTDTSGLQLSPLDMDLMGDLQDVIFRKCSSIFDTEETESPPIDRTVSNKQEMHSNSNIS
jgi:hypothetical protein